MLIKFTSSKIFSAHVLSLALLSVFSISLFSIASYNFRPLDAAMQTYENIVYIKLKDGNVAIELMPDAAPNHVSRFKELVRSGFYNGVSFHRVIDGFMAQTGDPTGTGMGGSGKKINAEFSKISHKRGIVSMARANDVNSADSQFFIVLKDSPFLDGQYTVFGKVISGMEYVDKIKKGDQNHNGSVTNPDKILSASMAVDVKNQDQHSKI